MNANKLESFLTEYRSALESAVKAHPTDYPWYPATTTQTVFDRMAAAIVRGSFNKDGHAFKATCKALGIKHTYTAIGEYLNG